MIGWNESNDKCAICVHEHENWGDNEYCTRCKNEEKEKQRKNKS